MVTIIEIYSVKPGATEPPGALRRVAPFSGPLLFLIFIFLVCFVLLNMFVAILSEAYMKAKARETPCWPRSWASFSRF
jgi:hypothetical protein